MTSKLYDKDNLDLFYHSIQGSVSSPHVGGIRHGVLAITVAHPALLEELSAFRKPELLAALREKVPGLNLLDVRFRVGPVEPDPAEPPPTAKPKSSPKPKRPKRGG